MFRLIKKIGGLFILAGFLFLTACGSNASQTPTPDPALIYTSAAQTVEAELTLTDEANPATATITPFPLITETSAVPTAILGSGSVLPTLPGPQTTDVSTTMTVAPTLGALVTPTLSQSHTQVEATWISNEPPDNALVNTNAKFDITWTLKNISKNTWTKKYSIRYFAGNIIVEKKLYDLKATVAPGDNGTFIVDAVAPSKSGTYSTWWKLVNELGVPVGDMSLSIVVVKPGDTPVPNTAEPTKTETTSP